MKRLLVIAMLGIPSAAVAQSGTELVGAGIRAYRNLELNAAAWMLRQSLKADGVGGADQARALMYLLATELLRRQRDSAAVAGRRLLALDPSYRPDPLVFPPEVQEFVAALRRETGGVLVRAESSVTFRPKEEGFPVSVFATAPHEITAAITRADGRTHRTLYSGVIWDSLRLRWDGLDSTGGRTPSGDYVLAVTSHDQRRRPGRTVRLPLQISAPAQDAVSLPPPPSDSLFLAERRPAWPAIRALGLGSVAAAAVTMLPRAVAPEESWSQGRYIVGGAVALSAIVSFIASAPGQPIPDNVARNRARWESWRNEVEAARRRMGGRGELPLTVRTGEVRASGGADDR